MMNQKLFDKLNDLFGVTATQGEIDEILNLFDVSVPKGTLSCGCEDHLTITFTKEGDYCGNCGKLIP